ncbi:cupin domain-containing protein [Chelatococcus daeguensis]|uniref:cupin domain-containing protein n=1 Tax=Chelatococcus daeguensis TaxID=444444 RepID=UPI0007ABBCDA|nr:cupin domain-containing protein [Chelatococcus daeguensis]KZE29329.1 cupin [Chelatococcus daeguensis]MBM3084063.1 cupin domain-containing protein [Chelatococcus daeguensis]
MAFQCTVPAVPTVQVDDANIRITRWDFAPGAVTGWHSHGWPYFVVLLTDGILRIHDGKQVHDNHLVAGQSYMRQAGVEHDVMNGSDHPLSFIEIEVKNPAAFAGTPGRG